MTSNKYNYCKVIQQNFGNGFEDVSEYECNSQGVTTEMSGKFKELKNGNKREISLLMHDLGEYKMTNYPTRVIMRRKIAQTA